MVLGLRLRAPACAGRSSTRSSTVSQVRLAPRRKPIADLQAERQPEALQLPHIDLERLRVAPEGLREIRGPDSGARRDRVEYCERPRAVAACTIESREPPVEVGNLVVAEPIGCGQHLSGIRLLQCVKTDAIRGEILATAQLSHRFGARRVAGCSDIPCADACGFDDVDRVDEQTTDRGAVHASGHDLRAFPPAEHHRDLAALYRVAVPDRDQHAQNAATAASCQSPGPSVS
jgi:hypothetical protein